MRPADVYHIDEEVVAWSFDRAVLTFGNALESKLQLLARNAKKQSEADTKIQREMDRWLSSADDPNVRTKGRFADPAGMIKAMHRAGMKEQQKK